MKERFFKGPEYYEEEEGWWTVLAQGGFLSPDAAADLEYIASNPMSHRTEIDFLERTSDIFEAHPGLLADITSGMSLLKEQLVSHAGELQEFLQYVQYLNDVNFFEKQAESSYYDLIKEASPIKHDESEWENLPFETQMIGHQRDDESDQECKKYMWILQNGSLVIREVPSEDTTHRMIWGNMVETIFRGRTEICPGMPAKILIYTPDSSAAYRGGLPNFVDRTVHRQWGDDAELVLMNAAW